MQNLGIPFTGDETQIVPYIVICGIAAVLILILIIASVLSRKKAADRVKGREPELESVDLEEAEHTQETTAEESEESE
jgi:hypothetical protein